MSDTEPNERHIPTTDNKIQAKITKKKLKHKETTTRTTQGKSDRPELYIKKELTKLSSVPESGTKKKQNKKNNRKRVFQRL